MTPIDIPARMTFTKEQEYISYEDASVPDFPDKTMDLIYHDDTFNGQGDKLPGFPSFTQADPGEFDEAIKKKYDTLLFRPDSGKFVMWEIWELQIFSLIRGN